MSRSARIRKGHRAGATQSGRRASTPTPGQTPDGQCVVSRSTPYVEDAHRRPRQKRQRWLVLGGRVLVMARAHASPLRAHRLSAALARGYLQDPGAPRHGSTGRQTRSARSAPLVRAKATSHFKAGGRTEAYTMWTYGGPWRTALIISLSPSIKS